MKLLKIVAILPVVLIPLSNIYSETENRIIQITQIPCQFIEMERKNLQFKSSSDSDCEKINSSTLKERSANFIPLKLKKGEYTFRVTNKGVPYEVGFYIRGVGFNYLTLPSISGGGLFIGVSKDYKISLQPGVYKMNCPLNPTPIYELIVE